MNIFAPMSVHLESQGGGSVPLRPPNMSMKYNLSFNILKLRTNVANRKINTLRWLPHLKMKENFYSRVNI